MCNVLIIKTLAGNLTNKGKLVLIGVLLLTILLRTLMFGLIIDTFVAFLIVLVYKNFKLTSKINTFLLHLGKHSFNIFLFHTFIFYLYFERLVYWNRNPLIIFITLIMICLPISYLIEYIKKGKKFFSSFKS